MKDVIVGLFIPFFGTAAGAACVFFLRNEPGRGVRTALNGFAAGVMVAASVWSLIIPAIELSSAGGGPAFLPTFAGFWAGALFLLAPERVVPRLRRRAGLAESARTGLSGTAMTVLALIIHNIPEGMAVGVVYAGLLRGSADITAGGALALAAGVAIQNFPEGAIISMPLYAEGKSRPRSFLLGVLSGAVEPVSGALTVLIAGLVVPAMPYLLSFAAGAMLYVVVEELIPETSAGGRSGTGALSFSAGFSVMMALDVALG